MEPLRVHIAELVIAADPASADVATADIVTECAIAAGHAIVERTIVADTEDAIRAQLARWIAKPDVDVVIITGPTESTTAATALKPLVTHPVPGFTDLFRWLAFQEIGAAAMQSNAEAAQCETTFVFVLPAVIGAIRAAMDKLINPQLDASTTPKNLVTQIPRLQPLVDAARERAAQASVPVEVDGGATEAVPTEIGPEKTEAGLGTAPRLPARKSPTGQHVVRKVQPPDVTRQVDRAQLERDLRASSANDAPTKPSIDIRKLLPRVPPGADDVGDDDVLQVGDDTDLTDIAPPQPLARVKLGRPPGKRKPPTIQIPALSGDKPKRLSDDATDELPPVRSDTIVTKAVPPAGDQTDDTPHADRPDADRPDTEPQTPALEAGTVGPGKSGATARPGQGAKPAKQGATATPGKGVHAKSDASSRRKPPALTPPAGAPPRKPASTKDASANLEVVSIADLAAKVDCEADEAAGKGAGDDEAMTKRTDTESDEAKPAEAATETSIKPEVVTTDEVPTRKARPPTEPPPPPAKRRPPTEPPPPPAKRRPPTEPPPPPIVRGKHPPTKPPPARAGTEELDDGDLVGAAAIVAVATGAVTPARKARTPTEPPPPRPQSNDLPRGKFVYPVHRSKARTVLVWGGLALVAAAAGIAFVKFFLIDKPHDQVAARPPPIADAASPPTDAPEVATVEPDASEIEMDVTGSGSADVDQPDSGHADPGRPDPGRRDPGRPDPGHHRRPAHPNHVAADAGVARVTPDAAVASVAPSDPTCDEVSCVLEKYARPCCARYKPKDSGFKPTIGIPEALDKSMVRAGVETVKPRVIACGEKIAAKGTVKVALVVGPDGGVKTASVVEAPEPTLGSCVAKALRAARFVKSSKGASFTYPFLF